MARQIPTNLVCLKRCSTSVLDLHGKILGAGVSTVVASVSRCQFCICPRKPVPASSKTDLLLAKTEPISNGGNLSVITYLRMGKKLLRNSSWERGVRICERMNSTGTQLSEEGGGGGAPGVGAEISLQPVVKTMIQAIPLQSIEVHSGAEIHLQPVEGPTPRAGAGAQGRLLTSWRAHIGAGSWQNL